MNLIEPVFPRKTIKISSDIFRNHCLTLKAIETPAEKLGTVAWAERDKVKISWMLKRFISLLKTKSRLIHKKFTQALSSKFRLKLCAKIVSLA